MRVIPIVRSNIVKLPPDKAAVKGQRRKVEKNKKEVKEEVREKVKKGGKNEEGVNFFGFGSDGCLP